MIIRKIRVISVLFKDFGHKAPKEVRSSTKLLEPISKKNFLKIFHLFIFSGLRGNHFEKIVENKNNFPVPDELIVRNIYLIRGKKVMLDTDLATLYGVSTRDLNKAVKRNILRFPDDFMFKLNSEEFSNLKFHFGTSRWGGTRKLPNAFTEQGIAMLSGILHSKQAIIVNIHIIRVFIKIREMIATHKEILEKLEELQKNDLEHERKILLIFNYLAQLEESQKTETEFKDRRRIGFKPD